MFKWHIQSAVSRSRPIVNDLKVVSDGIAASLRQFHASASRAENDQPDLRTRRTTRTAAATAELSSLKPSTPRAIDARSLAAAPPPTLRITREMTDSPRNLSNSRGGSFTPRGRGNFAPRGRGGFVPRGRGGFAGRGRGGAAARGRGGAGGRGGRGGAVSRGGRGGKGGRARGKRDSDSAAWEDEPLSREEIEYQNERDMGVVRPADSGATTQAILESEIPGLATTLAPLGQVETIRDHIRKLTGQHGNELLHGTIHARQYNHGNGTLFVNEDEKQRILGLDYHTGTPREYKPVNEKEREAIMKWLVAGQYPNVGPALANDTLGGVEIKTTMNPTYLPLDTASLKAKVQELLPVLKPKKVARKPVKARA